MPAAWAPPLLMKYPTSGLFWRSLAGLQLNNSMERKYRVLVLLGNAGLNGQERGNIQVFDALKNQGVESLFVTHQQWGHSLIEPALAQRDLKWVRLDYARHFRKGKRATDWPGNILRILRGSASLLRIIRQFAPTHIHVANPHYYLAVLPALLQTNIPIIYRLGDAPTVHHKFYVWLWRYGIIRRVDHFVCISQFVRQRLLGLGACSNETTVIYNYPPDRPAPAQPFSMDFGGTQVIVFVGQLIPDKGLHLFVDAAIQMCRIRNDVTFVVAGRLYDRNHFARRLIVSIIKAGLQHRIRFVGHVEDIQGLFGHSHIHVCPSLCDDAAPNVVMEAKRSGVPSIVFARGGLPEQVLDPSEGRVCKAETTEELVRTIVEILDANAADLVQLRQRSRHSINRLQATKEAYVTKWLSVYDDVATGH